MKKKRWILARVWVAFAYFVWIGGILAFLVTFTGRFPPPWATVPFVLISCSGIFLLLEVGMMRHRFSVLGPYQRTPHPDGPPLAQVVSGSGRVGWLRATIPFISWYVYPEGLGLALYGLWEGFVPWESVREVTVTGGKCRIDHDSPEVRTPIVAPAVIARWREMDSAVTNVPRKRNRFGLGIMVAIPVFMSGVLALPGLAHASSDRHRAEVKMFLGSIGPAPEVTVDGSEFGGPAELIEALGKMDFVLPHHSHPGRRFAVVVRGRGGEVHLELGRDSDRPDEYWVYAPDRGWYPDYNEIGRIHTDLLDHVPSSGNSKPRRVRERRK